MALKLSRAGLCGWMIVVAVCTGTPLVADDLGDRQGVQWAPYLEWTLDNAAWSGNPFDVVATVEFAHNASGETRRTQIFFVGETTWAFRFTGTRQDHGRSRLSVMMPTSMGIQAEWRSRRMRERTRMAFSPTSMASGAGKRPKASSSHDW